MGVTGFSFEFTSTVAPARMFKAAVLDSHNLEPKVLPDVISSAGLIHGDGGVGSVKQYKFTEGLSLTHSFSSAEFLWSESKTHVLWALTQRVQ